MILMKSSISLFLVHKWGCNVNVRAIRRKAHRMKAAGARPMEDRLSAWSPGRRPTVRCYVCEIVTDDPAELTIDGDKFDLCGRCMMAFMAGALRW